MFWVITAYCVIGVTLMSAVLFNLTKIKEDAEDSSTYDKWLEEKKQEIGNKLKNQKKYLEHLDEKYSQGVILDENYKLEFVSILKNINEIIEEMDDLDLFEKK